MPADDPEDCTRAASIIRRAREKLVPVSECAYSKIIMEQTKVGGPEALGALVRMAKHYNPSEERSASPQTVARLRASGEVVFEMFESMMLNWSVLFSLLLTVYASLAVLDCWTAAYVNASGSTPFTGLAEDNVIYDGSSASAATQHGAWSDLASYAWPHDEGAQAGVRRGLYVGEVALICVGLGMCITGLFSTLIMNSAFGMSLSDALTKYEFILENNASLGTIWVLFDYGVILLPFAIGCVAGRSSAVLSIGTFSLGTIFFLWLSIYFTMKSLPQKLAFMQQREVRMALRGPSNPSNRAGSDGSVAALMVVDAIEAVHDA